MGFCSVLYSIPSIAMFAMMIPFTGLGKVTAISVLVIYNQYLLLQNLLSGLNNVDAAVVEAAAGMGMTKGQTLVQIRLPLARKAIFSGIRLAATSTIGIATIAASINAGGLGTILCNGNAQIPFILFFGPYMVLLLVESPFRKHSRLFYNFISSNPKCKPLW